LDASNTLSVFWNRLSDATRDANALALPEGLNWLGEAAQMHGQRCLFVRPCYDALWKQLQEQLDRIEQTFPVNAAASAVALAAAIVAPAAAAPATTATTASLKSTSDASDDSDAPLSEHDVAEGDTESLNSESNVAVDPPEINGWVISGSPGIGKSCFCLFLLWKLRVLGIEGKYAPRSVLYRPQGEDEYVHFRHDGTCSRLVKSSDSWRLLFSNPRTFVITDAVEPPLGKSALSVLVTSPKRQVYWSFGKQEFSTFRYFPVFSWEEMQQCRETSFHASVRKDLMRENFLRWGGIVRYVLRHASDPSQQVLLQAAIDSVDLKALLKANGQSDAVDDACHRLLHVHVDDPVYINKSMVLASKYVSDEIVAKLAVEQRDELVAFLHHSAESSALSSLRGTLFESYAHNVLLRGGEFQVVNLHAPRERAKWRVQKLPLRSFNSWKDPQLKEKGVYLRPIALNRPTAEAYVVYSASVLTGATTSASSVSASAVPMSNVGILSATAAAGSEPVQAPSFLAQMTVSSEHNINVPGLKISIESLPALRDAPVIPVVFVVPGVSEFWDQYPVQKFVNSKHAVVDTPQILRPTSEPAVSLRTAPAKVQKGARVAAATAQSTAAAEASEAAATVTATEAPALPATQKRVRSKSNAALVSSAAVTPASSPQQASAYFSIAQYALAIPLL
jgi:hypothetical protein